MVYGNCPNCNAPYDRPLPCECDLKSIAQNTLPSSPPKKQKSIKWSLVTTFSCFFIK